MNTSRLLAALVLSLLVLPACDASKRQTPSRSIAPRQDVPILPVTEGDRWTYQVNLTIPADVTSPGAAAVDTSYKRSRTYLGKISPATGLPEVDCFEIIVPHAPAEREFVEITEDRIMIRGSMIMRPETTKPMWLDHPVPFVIAGMKPGTALPEIETSDGGMSRKTQIIAREEMVVPAGKFNTLKILTTGKDGDFELHRSVWFSPGTGIVREEKSRYRFDQLIFREVHQLIKVDRATR